MCELSGFGRGVVLEEKWVGYVSEFEVTWTLKLTGAMENNGRNGRKSPAYSCQIEEKLAHTETK